MTDHDAIAARVRQDMKAGTPGPWRVGPVDDTIVTAADGSEVAAVDGDYNEPDLWPIMEANARRIATLPDLEAAYLDLYDEVQRLRAERDRLRAALTSALDACKMLSDVAQICPLPNDLLPALWTARAALKGDSDE